MNRELKEQLNVIILSQHHGLSKPDQSSHGFSVDESKICGQPICPSLSRIFLTTKPFRNAKQITRSKSSRPDSIQTIQVAHRWKDATLGIPPKKSKNLQSHQNDQERIRSWCQVPLLSPRDSLARHSALFSARILTLLHHAHGVSCHGNSTNAPSEIWGFLPSGNLT